MNNRIETAIRQLIIKRRQQDVLLENIIKESLLLERTPIAKIVRTTNEDMQFKQSLGAEFVFAVVTKRVNEKQLATVIASAALMSGAVDKPDDKLEDIGAESKYATADDNEYQVDLDSKEISLMPKYYYLYGNIKQIGQRYRITVCIMDSNKIIPYRQKHFGGSTGDIIESEGKGAFGKVGNARTQSMKSLLTYINDFIENICYDKTWYSKNNVGMKYPPAAWYEFAGMTQPATEFTVQQILNQKCDDTSEEDETSTDNVQDDIQDVTDKKVGAATFTGTWNNTKGHPVTGEMKSPHADGEIVSNGTWTYDANSNDYWFSQGTKKYPDGDYYKGTFNASKFLDGEYYVIDDPRKEAGFTNKVYTTTLGYKLGGKIDTTKQFKITKFDDTTKKEVAYYEGTVDDRINPNNGSTYEDSTKTTETGTYTNGEWTSK